MLSLLAAAEDSPPPSPPSEGPSQSPGGGERPEKKPRGPDEKRRGRRRLSISTIVILALVAIAGIAYYLGTPPPLPSASTSTLCPTGLAEVVIPNGANSNSVPRFEPQTLTLVVGQNNTAIWDDQDVTSTHVIISVSVPPGGEQWDFTMTGDQNYCITLAAPGTYTYELYMSYGIVEGTLIVKAPSTATTSS